MPVTAGLHTTVRGHGPLLLFIPGGQGDGRVYGRVAELMQDSFTVLMYDRRGFSRSKLGSPVDDDARLGKDADDARLLIETFSREPAYVFGSSSGGIVAIELLSRHPEVVRKVVTHEPPMVRMLPNRDEYLQKLDEIYVCYQSRGAVPAMRRFLKLAGVDTPQVTSREFWRLAPALPAIARNVPFWFEHEFPHYPRHLPDLEVLRAVTGKLVLAGGRDSKNYFPYWPNTYLAQELGTTVRDLPGDHVGYSNVPSEFAHELQALLGVAGS